MSLRPPLVLVPSLSRATRSNRKFQAPLPHAAAAVATATVSVLREDEPGIPRSLQLLLALVEAETQRDASAASRPAVTSLVRAFRGGTAPKVPIRFFLERIHLVTRCKPASPGMIRIDGTCFVLAGVYLSRFVRSIATKEAGILMEPATAHRLVAAAVFLGTKFGGHPLRAWTAVFEDSSEGTIRATEMAGLEGRFLRAIGFRLFVDGEGFEGFCKILERGPRALSGAGGSACKKRQADAAAGEEDERRRVRARLRPPWSPIRI